MGLHVRKRSHGGAHELGLQPFLVDLALELRLNVLSVASFHRWSVCKIVVGSERQRHV